MIHHPVFLPICIFAPLIPSYHPFSIFWKQKNKSRIIAAKREPTPQKGCRFGPESSRLSPWFHPIFWYHLWQLYFPKMHPRDKSTTLKRSRDFYPPWRLVPEKRFVFSTFVPFSRPVSQLPSWPTTTKKSPKISLFWGHLLGSNLLDGGLRLGSWFQLKLELAIHRLHREKQKISSSC